MKTTVRGLALLSIGVASATLGWLGCGGDDAGNDLFSSQDASTQDTSFPSTDAAHDANDAGPPINPACIPGPVTSPSWAPPIGYPRGGCTDAQIHALLSDCYNPSYDASACAADQSGFALCYGCMFGTLAGTANGPLLHGSNDVTEVNYPGCLALATNDVDASSCAGEQGKLLSCLTGSCAACPGDAGIAAVDQCENASVADAGPCAPYQAAIQCGTVDAGVRATCYEQSGEAFQVYAARVAALFCGTNGGGPTDGGGDAFAPDASSDAGTDSGSIDASDDGG